MSTTSSGSSRWTARPIVSDFSATPGPEVVVTPSAPPNAAPGAAPIPAISSSAWKVRTPKFYCFDSSCRMSEAGVIGYEPRKSGRAERSAAAISP
jgi:predicted amidohydrolase